MASVNKGIAPPNPSTDVGKARLMSGDVSFVPLDPHVDGYGSYANWSDDQIQAALDVSGGSIARAISGLYGQLAAAWASTGATIKTDDLSYSAKDSVGSWLNLAKFWAEMADAEDERAVNNYFELVDMNGPRCCTPEGSPARRDLCCGRGW